MLRFTPSKHRGFTILEVLLVVAIIVLLIVALIPAIRPRQTAPRYELKPKGTPVPYVPVLAATPTPAPAPATPEPAK